MKMIKFENNKRIVSRAITFIDGKVLLMKRHNIYYEVHDYYTIPGGGVEEDETFSEAAIRETKEETCCDILIVKELEVEDFGIGICHWFYGKYISGTPTLGGEELERNDPNNSYEVVLVDINDIDNINILGIGRKLIKECFEEYKKSQ